MASSVAVSREGAVPSISYRAEVLQALFYFFVSNSVSVLAARSHICWDTV